MRPQWRLALWLGYILAVVLLMPAAALASNCSDPDDCTGMARGAAAVAAGAGAVAAAASNGNGGDGGGGGNSTGEGDVGGEGD